MKKIVEEHREVVNGVLITLGVIIVIVAMFFVSENIGDRSKDKAASSATEQVSNPLLEEGQVLDENQMKKATEITFDEFKELLKSKTTSVIMLGTDSCYWCEQQMPILESLIYEKDIDIKYLNIAKISEDDYAYIENLHEDLKELGTPTFISVKSKKVRQVSDGAKTKTQLIKMLVDMGIITE